MSDDGSAATIWLLSRIDRDCRRGVEELLNRIAEHISIATADAVTIRMLSGDGSSLLPVTAHHPDAERGAAMAAVMSETVQPVSSGLWQTVINSRRPARWHVPPGAPLPADASAAQVEFLRRFPLRAILAAPVIFDERLVGGVSVVRFVIDQPFTDRDEAMLGACASRIAPVLELQRLLQEADAISA